LGRPGSAGSATQQVAAPPAASSAPAARRCVMCGVETPAWLVLQPCKHMGPCLKCLPPPANMASKMWSRPAEYPQCLTCNKQVVQLLRMIM
jgi:hypothetical protein